MISVLQELENSLIESSSKIDEWLASRYPNCDAPIFSSIDVRQANFKITHVDANLFPAGFNNIMKDDLDFASAKFKEYMFHHFGEVSKILIVPEDFTRNTKYFENIKALERIITNAGFIVKFGSSFYEEQIVVSQLDLELNVLQRTDDKVHIKDFLPDVIILNNDLMLGLPKILENVSQPILPDPKLGWYARRKSNHFRIYNTIVADLAHEFKFDPWFISTEIDMCSGLDFRNKIGLDVLSEKVQSVLDKIQRKYSFYDIKDKPYVYVKADNGTYGMGIISVEHSSEILNINKKHRHSLNVIKSGVPNAQVLIQEGVPTSFSFQGAPAEYMIYSIGNEVVGNAIRSNPNKDSNGNLNSPGMQFTSQGRSVSCLQRLICKLMYIAVSLETFI